jgi:signal transduction histidine kinase
LVVRDEGTGIPEDHLDKIFEPDFTTKSGGMGLGLAIVENIIIGHGGSIKVESEMGRGTQFIITLPLTQLGHGQQPHRDGIK